MNEIFGWYACLVYSLYLIPQIIKTYRLKSVRDLSLASLWLTFSGALSMLIYLSNKNRLYPMKIHNFIGFLSIGLLLILYYKYKKNTIKD
tara:strand:+ start:694 stop:963 length:270 start_codon:yes stop_codon:yes gene_type:complete